jgi:hypothetical protein
MTEKNPKQEGSVLWSCRPQTGPCPNGCSECFYNRPGAYYCDINNPNIPTVEEVGDGIVRMNSGHDSNIEKDVVLETAKQYKHVFFNTSIPKFDFPGPVVFTANGQEEEPAWCPIRNTRGKCRQIRLQDEKYFDRIMFVRLRVSPTNWNLIEHAVACWTAKDIPVVLTFMAYYSQDPPGLGRLPNGFYMGGMGSGGCLAYVWKKRTLNSYWCPTKEYIKRCTQRMKKFGGRLVTICGTYDGAKCVECKNCETYYWQTKRHLKEMKVIVGEEK